MQPTRYSRYLGPLHGLGDLIVLNAAFWIAQGNTALENWHLAAFVNGAWFMLLAWFTPYRFSRQSGIRLVLRKHFKLLLLHFLTVTAFYVAMQDIGYSRLFLIRFYAVAGMLGLIWKTVFVVSLKSYRSRGFNYRNIAILGWGKEAQELAQHFEQHPEFGYRNMGYFDPQEKSPEISGDMSQLLTIALEQNLHEIYCMHASVSNEQLQELVEFGEEHLINIKLVSGLNGVTYQGLEVERFGRFPVLRLHGSPLEAWQNRAIKRTFDIVFSLLVVGLLMWWLVPIIALLVKLSSKGPVFFKQMRTGKASQVFTCYKFRTMVVNSLADEKQATQNDPRITGIGSFLRKTSLDELPQFMHVLLGQMSVVGPRPHMLSHTEEYGKRIGRYMERHAIRPGITGLAQVKGFRGETASLDRMQGRVRFDLFYVQKWSLLLDLRIVISTSVSILRWNRTVA